MARRAAAPLTDLELHLFSCAKELRDSGRDWFCLEELGEEHRQMTGADRRLAKNPLQTALNHLVREGLLTKRWEKPEEIDRPRPLRVLYRILGPGEPRYRTPQIRAVHFPTYY